MLRFAPFVIAVVALIAAAVAGWIVVEKTSLGLDGLFGAIALGLIVYGCWIAGSLLVTPWREKA